MLDEELSFATRLGDVVRLRVARWDTPELTHEQRVRARIAARELRVGVEDNDPDIVRCAQRIYSALHRDHDDEPPRGLSSAHDTTAFLSELVWDLERELEAGRLLVVEGALPLVGIPQEFELTWRDPPPEPEPPPPPPRPGTRPDATTFYDVRFVDEIGQSIGGLEVEFSAGGKLETATTNPAGVALLNDVTDLSASVSVASLAALEKLLDPRWQRARPGREPSGFNTQSFMLSGTNLSGVRLKPAVPNTIVIKPPLGKLFVELWDKTGRVRHAAQSYRISGAASYAGKTDEGGRLVHEDVWPGDYDLELSVEIDPGDGQTIVDTYRAPLVVLEGGAATPQERLLGAVPLVVMARLRGLLFDTHKSFLLPTARDALKEIRKIYEANNPSELLIVGHTDTRAEPDVNDQLSQERADSMKAYLEDDVEAWLQNYDLSGKKRWAAREDRLMIKAMPDFATRGEEEDLVEWYQRTRKLKVDGIAGEKTRRRLITEYMELDGVELSKEPRFHLSIKTHGAGESFPLKDTGFELDEQAANDKNDPFDRRVELFFFDAEFGIVPAPGAPDGKEYLEWRKRAAQNDDFPIEGVGRKAKVIELHDALFRTNSCVVLPEGETPSTEEHEALTSVGLIATTLRFSEEHPKKKLFVAGHTDTTSTIDFNQKLSDERARCALALLEGDRAAFIALANGRHTVADYKQILSWCSKAFTSVVFDCDPGKIDDNAYTGIEPVKRFQASYNRNKTAIGAASQPDLKVDGAMGPKTWGAMFDVYEFALREELGEDEAGVAALRERLVFVDDERKALGFSEHHPVDQIGRDNVRSQENRRVEIFFFDPGEEPDLVLAQSDPELSELYFPPEYVHVEIPPLTSAKREELHLRPLSFELDPVPNTPCTVMFGDLEQTEKTGPDGTARFKASLFSETCNVRWVLPDGSETLRKGIVINLAAGDEGTSQRLTNLGHEMDALEQKVRSHQVEFEREPTGNVSDVSEEVLRWHDAGLKPVKGSQVSSQQNLAKTSFGNVGNVFAQLKTAGPVVEAALPEPEELFPRYEAMSTKGKVWGMKVPAGCHTAISFIGAEKGKPIVVNTSPNTIDHKDKNTYLDVERAKDRRVFFYAKRVLPPGKKKDNPLMMQGTRVIFQVEVHEGPFRKEVLLAHLFGNIYALNATDVKIMWGKGTRRAVINKGTPVSVMVDKVLAEAAKVGGSFDHLVINGHGGVDATIQGALYVKIGEGIRRTNVHEFARLKSKVRYVWFQNCAVGADAELGGDMAFHTQARVSGPNWLTTDAKYPNHHVETGWDFRYWDGRGTTSRPKPMDRTEFFRQARRNQTPATDGSALDFNVVTKPKGPIP